MKTAKPWAGVTARCTLPEDSSDIGQPGTFPRSVIAAGYTPLDVVLHGEHVRHSAGGTAGNVAAILAFLGWESAVVGEVGSDPAGSALRADLERSGVSTVHLLQTTGSTTRVVHKTGANGHSYHFSCPSCGVRFPRNRRLSTTNAERLAELLDPPGVFFFDRANPGTVRLAEKLADRGVLIVFEPASGIKAAYALKAFHLAHILKFSTDSGINLHGALGIGLGRRDQIQISTSGRRGAQYRVGDSRWRTSPAFEYPTVDEAGAGDWTTACFLHALTQNTQAQNNPTVENVGDALTWAQAVAAVSCGFTGARGLAHARSCETVLQSAQQLVEPATALVIPTTNTTESAACSTNPYRIKNDELSLLRAYTRDVCSTCLEPTTSADRSTAVISWDNSIPMAA